MVDISGAFCRGSVAFYVLYMFEGHKYLEFGSSYTPGGSFLILFRMQLLFYYDRPAFVFMKHEDTCS